MENLSQHMFVPAGLFPRKAKKQPFGWKISLDPSWRLPDFSPERPKTGLADGIMLFLRLRRRAVLCEERRRAPAAPYMTGMVYTKACHSLFPGAYAPIASLAPAVTCHMTGHFFGI